MMEEGKITERRFKEEESGGRGKLNEYEKK